MLRDIFISTAIFSDTLPEPEDEPMYTDGIIEPTSLSKAWIFLMMTNQIAAVLSSSSNPHLLTPMNPYNH